MKQAGVDYLGVATIDEGIELRENGIQLPILVMSGLFPWDEIGPVVKNELSVVVYDAAYIEKNRGCMPFF